MYWKFAMSGASGKNRRAWLTPDQLLPDAGTFCRHLSIPNDPQLIAAVSGALHELTLSYNWEQHGTMTPEQAARLMDAVLWNYFHSDGCEVVPAPYWDDSDGDDSDGDEESPFPWYEDLADWIVQAFLATSFTPAAAITFVTTARKIRLAFRTASWGALADIFIDNVLMDTVDTYSHELDVVEYAYDLDLIQPAAFTALASETATLRIVHRGEANSAAVPTGDGYGVSIIRKRLQSSIFTPSSTAPTVKRIYRVLRSGKMQYSDDGGETWDDTDTLPEYPPLPPRTELTAYERRCLAARNAAEVIRLATIEVITVWNATTDPLQTISDLAGFITGAVALFLGNPMLALVATGFELFQNVLAVIEAGLDTAWNAETTDKLTCLLFELAIDDGAGKVTFDFEGVRYRGNEVYSDARLIVIHHWLLGLIGGAGLDLAGATTSVASWDCVGCVDEWCYEWSSTEWNEWDIVTDVAWLRTRSNDNNVNAATTVTDANGWLGSGYNQQRRPVAIQLSFPSATFVSVVTASGSGTCYFSDSRDNYATVRKVGFGDFNVNDYVEGVRVFVYAASNPRLSSVVAQGEGSEPFGQSNCEE